VTGSADGAGTATVTATASNGVSGSTTVTVGPGDFLFYDRFSGANNTLLSAHTPDLNRLGAGWVLIGLAPRLSDGLATVPGVSDTWQSAVLETTAADLTLATDWRAGTGGWPWCGLIVRYVDDNNRLMVVCDQNTLALWRRQAGNWVVVQSVSWPVTAGTTHHLQATLAGSSIQVWADGVLKLQVTESFNVAATRHGLGWAPWVDPEGAYDNFEVRGNLPAAVTHVVVTPTTPTLPFGTTQPFVAQGYDAVGYPVNAGVFAWSTSNAPVLRLTSSTPNTSVTAAADGLGTATVTATASNGVTGSTAVTIAAGDILFYDRFDGADGTLLSAHAANVNRLGVPWVLAGVAPRLSDGLAIPGASSAWESALLETTAADLTLATDWHAGTGSWPAGAMYLRYTDDNNRLLVIGNQNRLELSRRQAGIWTLVQSVPWSVTPGTTHHLQATLAGSSIQVWADGVLMIQATESFNATATRHGLVWVMTADPEATYDNFEIRGTLPPAIASVVVTPSLATIAFRATQTFVAHAFDTMGQPVNAGVFAWTTSNPVALTVPARLDTTVIATGQAPGRGTVIATALNGVSGSATVTVDSAGILIHDSFLEVDGTPLSAHRPDIDQTGGTWSVVGSPTPRITAEQLTISGGTTQGLLSVIDSTAANATVGVDWRAGPGLWPYAGLVLRYADSANYLQLVADQATLAVWRVRAGVATLVSWTALPVTPGSTHRLQAVLNGSSIQASVDGVVLLTASESFNQTATRHGLAWYPPADPDATYDNFDIVGTGSGSSSCGMSVSPTHLTLGTAASSGTLTLLASAAPCGWQASSDSAWITTTPVSGSGSAPITYTVQNNTGTWGRSANLTVAGQTIAVTQNGIGCQYAFSPSTIAVGYSGISGSFSVTAPTGCAWDARNTSAWMTLYNYIGNGNGRVDYVIGENGNTQSRGWYVKVNSEPSVWFEQAGNGCESVFLSSSSATFGGSGGVGNFNVTAGGDCAWHVETTSSWIQTTSSGNGSGSVAYTAYENPGDVPRSGTLTIVNATYTVYQEARGSGGVEPSAVSVTLTSPAPSAIFSKPATLALAANAITTNGGIARVDFYLDGSLVGSDKTSPYQSAKTLSAVGTHSVRAWAVDTSGDSAMSGPVYVVIRQSSSGTDRPVVFAHGLASGPGTWDPVAANLQERLQITSFKFQTPSTSTYEDQAASLESNIAALGSSKIIVGHSNGGIVAREVSKYESLKGIVTIGTPHRGVPLLNHRGDVANFANEAWNLMGQIAEGLSSGAKQEWWNMLGDLQRNVFNVVSARTQDILFAVSEVLPSLIFPVTPEMNPDGSYLAVLNSQQNRDRERSAVPIRVGIINTARSYDKAGPFRLFFSDAQADGIGDTMRVAEYVLFVYSGQLRGSVSHLPPLDPERQKTEALASKLFQLSSWLARIDPLWCAWVSTVGQVNQLNPDPRQCLDNDELVPAWSQLYPDAFNRRVIGAPHTRETTESEDTLYEMLTSYLQVSPRTGAPAPVPTEGGDSLYPGETLYPGQSRDSSDGRFHLVYQGDGNLVLYNQNWSALWSTNTVGSVGFVAMQGDGNFVVYDAQGTARWSSSTGVAGAYLVVRSDGTVAIYTPKGVPIWSTGPLK
jgi:hypothetical protein